MDNKEISTRAAIAGLLGIGGLAIGGPVGAIAAPVLKEFATPHAKRLYELVLRRHESGLLREIRALQEAERIAAIDADRMLAAVLRDPKLQDLFARALSAAYESALESKTSALARSMATAAQDATTIDEEQLFVSTVRLIEQPHANFLKGIVELAEGGQGHFWKVGDLAINRKVSVASGIAIVKALDGLGCVVTSTLANLDHSVEMHPSYEHLRIDVTEYGRLVCARLTSSTGF